MRSFILRFLVVPVAAVTFGCSGDINNLPTTPDPVISTETFTGTLTVHGGSTHNVVTSATGVVNVTLTSLGENPPAKVGLSLGTLGSLAACSAVITNDNAIVTSAITGTVSSLAGSLCVRIYDTGALTESVDYTITVTHP